MIQATLSAKLGEQSKGLIFLSALPQVSKMHVEIHNVQTHHLYRVLTLHWIETIETLAITLGIQFNIMQCVLIASS